MTGLAALLADCEAHGVRLLPTGDGGLTIDAVEDALTPDLVDRLRAHKDELLATMRPIPDAAPALPRCDSDPAAPPAEPVCRCGSPRYRDTPIHTGQSARRDCAGCGRFLDFPVWYGSPDGPRMSAKTDR